MSKSSYLYVLSAEDNWTFQHLNSQLNSSVIKKISCLLITFTTTINKCSKVKYIFWRQNCYCSDRKLRRYLDDLVVCFLISNFSKNWILKIRISPLVFTRFLCPNLKVWISHYNTRESLCVLGVEKGVVVILSKRRGKEKKLEWCFAWSLCMCFMVIPI